MSEKTEKNLFRQKSHFFMQMACPPLCTLISCGYGATWMQPRRGGLRGVKGKTEGTGWRYIRQTGRSHFHDNSRWGRSRFFSDVQLRPGVIINNRKRCAPSLRVLLLFLSALWCARSCACDLRCLVARPPPVLHLCYQQGIG